MPANRMPVSPGRTPIRGAASLLSAVLAFAALLFTDTPSQAQAVPGAWITVRGPITSDSVARIKNQTEQALRKGAKRIVYAFEPGEVSTFGSCSELADVIIRVQGEAETYAYIEGELRGHAVLPALACQYLWMRKDGAIGDVPYRQAGAIGEPEQLKYLRVAELRGRPEALVLKMLYPDVNVYRIKTDQGEVYKLEKSPAVDRHRIRPEYVLSGPEANLRREALFGAGEVGLFRAKIGEQDGPALKTGLCGLVVESPQEVRERLNLAGAALFGDARLDRIRRAAVIRIEGELDRGNADTVSRQIDRAVERDKVNCLIFRIESHGGPESVRVAHDLAVRIQKLNDQVLTVAFVPGRVSGAANFLVFACSQIVLADSGEFGDCTVLVYRGRGDRLPEQEVSFNRDQLVRLAEKQGYPPALVRGLMDPPAEIVQVESVPRPGRAGPTLNRFMTRAEYERAQDEWRLVGTVKRPGALLKFNKPEAIRLGLAVNDEGKVKEPSADSVARLYGINPDSDLVVMSADWLDQLVNILAHPVTTTFLVIIGLTCLFLEVKAPGMGLPAILAAVCFILVFWAHSWLSREVNALAILLFLLGLILLAVELFVIPGFGVTGISGILLVLLGLALVAVKELQSRDDYIRLGQYLGLFSAGLIAAIFAAYTIGRYLPNIPYANRLVLPPPDESEGAVTLPPAHSPALLGAIGVAVTTLRPAGKARFGEEFVDVVAEGHYVEAGARVQVIEIDGVRVVVKPV